MLAVLITLTPGHQNEFIVCQKAKLPIAVLPIIDVNTRWNPTLELLECAFRLCEFTPKWLENPKYSDYQPPFTTPDELTIVKYVMEVLRPFLYWTLWMSKRHTVMLHHVITVYNDMFDHMDGVIRGWAKCRTPLQEDLFLAVRLARQKLSKYFTEVTPSTGKLLISAYIFNPLQKLRSFRKWDGEMDINPEGETFNTTPYQEAGL